MTPTRTDKVVTEKTMLSRDRLFSGVSPAWRVAKNRNFSLILWRNAFSVFGINNLLEIFRNSSSTKIGREHRQQAKKEYNYRSERPLAGCLEATGTSSSLTFGRCEMGWWSRRWLTSFGDTNTLPRLMNSEWEREWEWKTVSSHLPLYERQSREFYSHRPNKCPKNGHRQESESCSVFPSFAVFCSSVFFGISVFSVSTDSHFL